jgi:transposase
VGIWVGIDIAKGVHWATAIDDLGQVVWDQRVANDPAGLQQLIQDLAGLGGEPVIGLDVVGGIAALAEAMLGRPGSGWSMSRGWREPGPPGHHRR